MQLKEALHAHDRGANRLNLSPKSIDALQRAADAMWYSHGRQKLPNSRYYSKITDDHNNVRGYAAFKRVGPPTKERLILATILSNEMRPKNQQDISHFFNTKIKDKIEPHPLTPETYKGMPAIPNNKNN